MGTLSMSSIDYGTVAVIAMTRSFFGAFATEFAKYLIERLKKRGLPGTLKDLRVVLDNLSEGDEAEDER